jgi:leucine dehydrogenase
MSVFEARDFDHHETVAFFNDRKTGLKAIIAIHSTALGPSCGGTRMFPYASTEAALTDVLRLSKGMSYKSAIANLPLGGGKAVIIADPARDKSDALFMAYANAINTLGGRYLTAMDVGMKPGDMPIIARGTKYIAGFDQPGKAGGDSAPPTALGVFIGLKAAVKHRLGVDTTKGLIVAIQGLGKVGMDLAARLHAEGAYLVVSDVHDGLTKKAADAFGAKIVPPDAIVTTSCDVLSPNAMGAILNDVTIPQLHARVIAGAANNQLARDEHGEVLRQHNVLYAPDYAINGGGIIRVAAQIYDWSDAEVDRRVHGIGDTLNEIFRRSDSEGVATNTVADRIAEERMAKPAPTAKAAE